MFKGFKELENYKYSLIKKFKGVKILKDMKIAGKTTFSVESFSKLKYFKGKTF